MGRNHSQRLGVDEEGATPLLAVDVEKADGGCGVKLGIAIAVLIAIFAGLIALMISESREWEAFKLAHHCKKVGEIEGGINVGVGYGTTANGQSGMITTVTPDFGKIGWQCDDGKTYWRNK